MSGLRYFGSKSHSSERRMNMRQSVTPLSQEQDAGEKKSRRIYKQKLLKPLPPAVIPSMALCLLPPLMSQSLSIVIHLTLVAELNASWRLPVVLGTASRWE